MPEIYNWAYRPKGEKSTPGTGKEPEYAYKYAENGKRSLVKTGEVNVYAKIQTYKDETDITNIIRRATYDPEALGSIAWMQSGETVDITDMPSNYHEMMNRITEVENQFAKLPAEIKAKFDNSAGQYITEYGSETWAEKVGYIKPERKEPERKEVVTDESKQ